VTKSSGKLAMALRKAMVLQLSKFINEGKIKSKIFNRLKVSPSHSTVFV